MINVAMALAEAYPGGLGTVAEVLGATGRNAEINHLWAALAYLSSLLPEATPDAVAWASLARPQGYRRSHPRPSPRRVERPTDCTLPRAA